METSTLTQKGQATIPKRIRDFLGIQPHEQIAFHIKGESVIIERASFFTDELAGALKKHAIQPIPSKQDVRSAWKELAVQEDLKTK